VPGVDLKTATYWPKHVAR